MQLSELIKENCEIPLVPHVAMKIIGLVDNPRTEIAELQNAIMADQALAARILQMSNSAYFGLCRTVDTISDAVVLMGFNSVRNLALAVSTRNVYKKFGLLEKKLWDHSLGVSIAAGVIAREAGFRETEDAVMAGLLHDLGKIVMNNGQPDKFLLLTEAVYNENATFSERERDFFTFGHAEAGGLFARMWKFPEHLCEVIKNHHSYAEDFTFEMEGRAQTLCYVTALADALCLRLGVGYREPVEDITEMETKWREMLGISAARYPEVVEHFKKMFVQEKMLYQT